MKHIKYPSHSNHYDGKSISWLVNHYPDIATGLFQITEKLHGSNVSVLFAPFKEMQFASRNHLLTGDSNIFGLKEHVASTSRYDDLFSKLQTIANERNVELQLYGEIFGKGVMPMDYGEKQIRFFDLRMDDLLITKHSFNQIVPSELAVPLYATDLTLEEALKWDIDTTTKFGSSKIEGVVISPINDAYKFGASRFNIKFKNDDFIEKKSRVVKQYETRLVELRADFFQYINMARVENVMSHIGQIESQSQIGKYIVAVMNDAKTDFFREYDGEHDLTALTKQDEKYIFNAGGLLAPMLKEQLSK